MANEDETIRLSLDASGVAAGSRQANQSLDTIATTSTKVDAAVNKAAGSTRNWTQVVMAASYGVADLNYGLGGFLNNIPSIIMGLGLGGGLSTVLQVATAGVSTLYLQWGHLSQLFASDVAIPQAVDQFGALSAELARVTKQIEALRQQERGSADDLARYNRLIEQQAGLERQVAENQERQANIKTVQGIQASGTSETVAGLKKAIEEAGGGPAVSRMLREKLGDDSAHYDVEAALANALQGDTLSRSFLKGLAGGTPFGAALDRNTPEAAAEQRAMDQEITRDQAENWRIGSSSAAAAAAPGPARPPTPSPARMRRITPSSASKATRRSTTMRPTAAMAATPPGPPTSGSSPGSARG